MTLLSAVSLHVTAQPPPFRIIYSSSMRFIVLRFSFVVCIIFYLRNRQTALPTCHYELKNTHHEDEMKMAKTAIVITSSWVPSHPSTSLMETVINSTFERLIGLPSTTPIFITVDHFPYIDKNVPPELGEKIANLEDYVNY